MGWLVDCDVPERYEDKSLGEWVKYQRKRKATLREDQIKRLDELGFNWDSVKKIKADKKWNEVSHL